MNLDSDMSVLDTPTKAAQCPRPKTRGWLDLVRAAREDEAEAARLRAELKRYLAGADRLSARRAARRGGPPLPAVDAEPHAPVDAERTVPGRRAGDSRAPSPPRKKKKKVPDGAGQPEHAAEPEIPDWSSKPAGEVVAALGTLGTPWTDRMAALRAVRERSREMIAEDGLISGLCVQVDDLRSKIVVESAETVLVLAHLLSASQCVALFSAAMAGIAVKKAVMGDAREKTMKGAMRPAVAHDEAWDAVREAVGSARHERGRRVGVDIVAAWVSAVPLPEARDGAVAQVLAKGIVDKAAVVRDAAKKLEKAYADKQGVVRSKGLRMLLPADARTRLAAAAGASSGTQKGVRRNLTGRPNMKELIRQKKMAMMKTEAAKKAAAFNGNENTPPSAGNVGENRQTTGKDRSSKGSKLGE